MRLLLDTHLLLWTVSQSRRISPLGRQLIGDPENEPSFSTASLWEVAIKGLQRRPDFDFDPRVLRRNLLDNGYAELMITGAHAVAVADLPLLHRDPFDRMLVAQYAAPVRRV